MEQHILTSNGNSLVIPNFCTPPLFSTSSSSSSTSSLHTPLCEPVRFGDPSTDFLLKMLGLPHVCTVPYGNGGGSLMSSIQTILIEDPLPSAGSECFLENVGAAAAAEVDPNEVSLDDIM